MPCKKAGNKMMIWSDESMTLITSYRLPRHISRSFASTQNDALPLAALLSTSKKGVIGQNELVFNPKDKLDMS